jgi:HlyD family secretion protein
LVNNQCRQQSVKKKTFRWVLLVAVGLAGGVAYWRLHGTAEKAVVQQAAVARGDVVQVVRAIGTLTALRSVRVGPQVSGTIKALHVDFNSVVRKGQILAELDPSLLETQVAVQEANLARQENEIEQQRIQLAQERRTLERTEVLFQGGLASRQQLDVTQLQVRSRLAQIAALEKQKVQAQSQLNQAQLNVSYCTLRSPIDGVIVSRMVDVGQTVQASGSVPQFFTIATDLTTLKITAGVDESDIDRIRRHMTVTFTVDAYRDQTFEGEVEAVRLNAQIQNNVVTYPVWIHVPNADLKLRPSMTANVQIVVDTAPAAVLVPNNALRFHPTPKTYEWLSLPTPAGDVMSARRISPPELVGAPETEDADTTASDEQIDDQFPRAPKRVTPGEVWVYDEDHEDPGRRLRRVGVRTGVTDGEMTEVVSGDLELGAMVVTGIIPPVESTGPSLGIFDQGNRSRGGMTPAGPVGPPVLNQPNRGGGRGGGGRGGA